MYKNKAFFSIILVIFLSIIPHITVSAEPELKIGIVNLDALFKEIPIFREYQAKLQKEFEPQERKVKNLQKEWNSLNEKYLKNEKIMSDNEKKDLVQKIKSIEQTFRSTQETFQKEFQEKQANELRKVRTIVESAITDYAEENDFDLIIKADRTALYAKKYLDITREIISKLQ